MIYDTSTCLDEEKIILSVMEEKCEYLYIFNEDAINPTQLLKCSPKAFFVIYQYFLTRICPRYDKRIFLKVLLD